MSSKKPDDTTPKPEEPAIAADSKGVDVSEEVIEDTVVSAAPIADDEPEQAPPEPPEVTEPVEVEIKAPDTPGDDAGGSGDGEGEDEPPKRGRLYRFIRWCLKSLGLLVALIFLLVTLVLVFPYHYIAAPVATTIMEDFGWDIDLDVEKLSLLSGLEITDITVRPPKDFSHTPLTAKRLALHYSLWQVLTSRRLVVKELALEDVNLVYEDRGGQGTNLAALLAGFGGDGTEEPEPEPEPEIEEPSDPGEPWWLEVQQLKLSGINGRMVTPEEFYGVAGLGLDVAGEISTTGDGESSLTLYMTDGEAPGIEVTRTDIEASVRMPFSITVKQKDLTAGTASIHIPLKLKGTREGADLPKTSLDLNIEAQADRAQDTGRVDALVIKLNDAVVADASATVTRLFNNPAVSLAVKTLGLDLASVKPLAALFVKDIELKGRVGLEKTSLDAQQSDLDTKRLPAGSVIIGLRNVSATLPETNIDVRNFEGQLTLNLNPDAPEAGGAYQLSGAFNLEGGTFPGASVKGLDLSLDVDLLGLQTPRAELGLGLKVKTLKAAGFTLPVKLDLSSKADATGGMLEQLHLTGKVGKLLNLDVAANAEELGRKGRITLSVKTGPIASVLKALPSDIAASLPKGFKAKGSVALKATAGWKLPWKRFLTMLPKDMRDSVEQYVPAAKEALAKLPADAPQTTPDVFALPLNLTAQLDGKKLDVSLPSAELRVKEGNLSISAKGRLAKLHVTGTGGFPSIVAGPRSISEAGLEIDATVSPSSVTGQIGLTSDSLVDASVPADIAGLSMKLDIDAPLRKYAPIENQATLALTLGADVLRQGKPGAQNYIEEMALVLNLVSGKKGAVSLDGTINAVAIDSMAQAISIEGVGGTIKATTTLDAEYSPTGSTRFTFRLNGGSVDTGDRLPFELEDNRMLLDIDSNDGMRQITLRALRLDVPSLGLTNKVTGSVYPLILSWKPFKMSSKPNADIDLDLSMDNEESLELPGPTIIRGNAHFNLELALHGDEVLVRGDIGTTGFSVGMTSKETDPAVLAKAQGPKSKHVFIDNLNLSIPFSQKMQIRPAFKLLTADTSSILGKQGGQTLYDPLREWSSHRRNVTLKKAGLREFEGNKLIRNVELDRLDMDLRYKDNVFRIDRMHLGLLGGDIIGQLAVQLLGDDLARPRLRFSLQASGVNLGYLTLGRTNVGKDTEVSALMETDVDLHSGDVGGRINITEISLSQLDKLLQFLDPTGTDPKIQKNRQLLSMASMLRPKVSLVSIWLEHQNLNMDINIESIPVIEGILQNILDNFRLRRYSISAILKRYVPQPTQTGEAASTPSGGGASAQTGSQEDGL